MKKKQTLLFLLFSLALIVTITLCLIFVLKTDDGDGNKLENGKPGETNFNLASENTIFMDINSSIEFLDDFFVVSNTRLETLSCEVCSYYNSDVTGMIYQNRKLTATVADTYKLKFSVELDDKTITREVKIVVEDSAKIKQKTAKLNVGENYNITDIFAIDSQLSNLKFDSCEYFTINNSVLTPIKTGMGNVGIYYIAQGIKHNYNFVVKFLTEPDYDINASNVESYLHDEFCYFNYEVVDRSLVNDGLSQEVLIEIENEDIVELVDITAPIATLRINGVGTTNVRIKLKNKPEIAKTIQVTILN